jgi:myo-inositol-1(or 4)-monophosphatase
MRPETALDLLVAAAEAAGHEAMRWFRPGQRTSAHVTYKAGDSPVSEADLAANAMLKERLRLAHPGIGWISEETTDDAARLAASQVFIADPIDGTRAFIDGDPQWSVSVALAERGVPVAGIVHAPALGVTYAAAAGGGAFRNSARLACSSLTMLDKALVAGPRPALDRLEAAGVAIRRAPRTPSLALRLVRAAAGEFDVAAASEGAHDWDIAAADVILREAGGELVDTGGRTLVYNAPELRRGALAAGPAALTAALIARIGLRS